MTGQLTIYVADTVSVSKGNFHWVSSNAPEAESNDIAALADSICQDAQAGQRIAVGFECPLFVPCPREPLQLGTARPGEIDPAFGSRPFNAGAGASATLTGFQALGWVLREARRRVPGLRGTTRWDEFAGGECRLLLWEAFVSGSEKGAGHHEDAVLALRAFEACVEQMATASRIGGEAPVSLAGALILWAGLSDDLTLLHDRCIVLRPVFEPAEAAARLSRWKAAAAQKRLRKIPPSQNAEPDLGPGSTDEGTP